jgi:hypothetical protein
MLIASDSPAVGLSSDMPDISHVPRYERPIAHDQQHDDDFACARRRRRRKRKAKYPGATSASDRSAIQWWLQRSLLGFRFTAPETEQAFLFYIYQGHMYLIAALLVLTSICTTLMVLSYPTARSNPHTSALLVHLTVTAVCSLGFGVACVAWVHKFMRQADDQVSEALAAHHDQSNQGNPLLVGNTRVMHIPAAGTEPNPQNPDNEDAQIEMAQRRKAAHDTATRKARQKQHPFGGSRKRGNKSHNEPNAEFKAAPIYAVLTQQSDTKAVQVRAFEVFATLLGLCFASVCSFQFYEMALCEALMSPEETLDALRDAINPCSTFIPTVDLISQMTLVVILSPRALLTVPLVMLCTFGMFIPAMIGRDVVLATRNEMGIQGAVKCVTFMYLVFLSVLQDRTSRRRFEDSIRLDLALLKTVDVRQELDEILEVIFPDKQVLDRIVTRKSVVDSSEFMAVGLLEVRDFLKWTTTMLPADTINIVGFLYGTYDRWADTFGLDYVKAVGDRYLAVSGIRSSNLNSNLSNINNNNNQRPRTPAECIRAIMKFSLRQQKVIQDVNSRVSTVLEPITSAVAVHVGPGLGMMMGSQYVLSYEMVGPAIVTLRQLITGVPAGRVTASTDAIVVATRQHQHSAPTTGGPPQLLTSSMSYNPYRKGSCSTSVFAAAQTPITFPASVRPAGGGAVTVQRRHNNSTTFVNDQEGVIVAQSTTAAAGDVSVALLGGSHPFHNFSYSRGDGDASAVEDNSIFMSLKASSRGNSSMHNTSSAAISISLDDKEFIFTMLPHQIELLSDGKVVRRVNAADVQSRRQQQPTIRSSTKPSEYQIDEPAAAVRAMGESAPMRSHNTYDDDDDDDDAFLPSDRGLTSPNTDVAAVVGPQRALRQQPQPPQFQVTTVEQRLGATEPHLKQFHAMGSATPARHPDLPRTSHTDDPHEEAGWSEEEDNDDDDIFTGMPPPMSVALAPVDDIGMALAQPNRCLQDAMHAALVEVPQASPNRDGAVEASALQNQRLRYVSIIKMVRLRQEQHYERTATLGTAVGSSGRHGMLRASEDQQLESIRQLARSLSAVAAAPTAGTTSLSLGTTGEQALSFLPTLFGSGTIELNPLAGGNATLLARSSSPGGNNHFAEWHGTSGEVGNIGTVLGQQRDADDDGGNPPSPTLTGGSDVNGRLPLSPEDNNTHPLHDASSGRQPQSSIIADNSNGENGNSANPEASLYASAGAAVPFGREGFELFLKQLRPDIAREIEAEEAKRATLDEAEVCECKVGSVENSELYPVESSTTTPNPTLRNNSSAAPSVTVVSVVPAAGDSNATVTRTSAVTPLTTGAPPQQQRKQQQQLSESIASQMQSYISLLDVIRRGLPPPPPTLEELQRLLEEQFLTTPSPIVVRIRHFVGRVKYFLLYPTIIRRVIVPFESPIITAAYRRFHIRHSWRWKQVAYVVHAAFLSILIILIGMDLAYVNVRLPDDTLAPISASCGDYARSRGFPMLVIAAVMSWARFFLGLKKWSFAKPPAPTLVGCFIGNDTAPIEIDKYTFHLVQEVAGIDRRTAAAAKAMVHSASDSDGDDDNNDKDENGNPLGVGDIMITGIKFPKWYLADLGVLGVTMFLGHVALAAMPRGIITNEAIFLVLHHVVIIYLVTTCYMHMIILCTVNVMTFLFSHFVIYVVALGGNVGSNRLILVVLYLVGGMLMAWARELKQVYHFELLALHRAVLQATKEELVLQRHLFSVLLPACMRDGTSVAQIAAHRRTMADHAHGISGVPLLPPVRIHYSDLCTIAIRLDPKVFAGIMINPAMFVAKMDSILNAIECVVYQANALILARRRYAHQQNNAEGMSTSSSSDDDGDSGETESQRGGKKFHAKGGGSSVTREELISRIHVKGDIILFAGPMVRETALNKKQKQPSQGDDEDNDVDSQAPPVNTTAERLVGRALEVMLMISKALMEAEHQTRSATHRPPPQVTQLSAGSGKLHLGESGGADVGGVSFTSSGGVSAGLYAISQKQSGEPRMLFPVSLMNSADPQRSLSPSSCRGGVANNTATGPPVVSAPQQQLRLTSVACIGSGFVTMLGSRGLTPSLMGSVARQTSALILAAPTGFHGCSSHFLHSLPVYGVVPPRTAGGNISEKSVTVSTISDVVEWSNEFGNHSGTQDAKDTSSGIIAQPLQRWRIRGSGVMLVHPLALDGKVCS